jgi:hypothetical protein
LGRDGNVTAKEKQRKDGQSFADSDEMREFICRKELDKLSKDKAQKTEHRKSAQISSMQEHKSPSKSYSKQASKQKPGEEKKPLFSIRGESL